MPSAFDNPAQLRDMFAPPPNPSAEPRCNFPLAFYEEFLREIKRLNIQVITYRDLFERSDDWNYRANFPGEYKQWQESHGARPTGSIIRRMFSAMMRRPKSDPRSTYLLIQHDVDGLPFFTKRM